MPQRNTPRRDGRGRGFENSERLRELLTRLGAEGPDAWRNDPVAAELMRYAADKYAALARKHGLDPWEAAAAAFEAMRTPSVPTRVRVSRTFRKSFFSARETSTSFSILMITHLFLVLILVS